MAAEDFAAALRRQRQMRGLSLRELAGLTHYGKSYLSDLEHGRRQPHSGVAGRLDEILKANGELVSLAKATVALLRPPPTAQALRVAVAVVRKGRQVLLVRRREQFRGMSWQFPAGIVKPDAVPADMAIAETLAETDVLCTVTSDLGSRLHPITGVVCNYFLCDYLSGDATNRDPLENAAVMWLEQSRILTVIPPQQLFERIREALGDAYGRSQP